MFSQKTKIKIAICVLSLIYIIFAIFIANYANVFESRESKINRMIEKVKEDSQIQTTKTIDDYGNNINRYTFYYLSITNNKNYKISIFDSQNAEIDKIKKISQQVVFTTEKYTLMKVELDSIYAIDIIKINDKKLESHNDFFKNDVIKYLETLKTSKNKDNQDVFSSAKESHKKNLNQLPTTFSVVIKYLICGIPFIFLNFILMYPFRPKDKEDIEDEEFWFKSVFFLYALNTILAMFILETSTKIM